MKLKLSFFTAALVASILGLGSKTSYAQAWRCFNDPNLPECEDGLINDIEFIIDRDWPTLNLTMPSLPYTCNKKQGTGHMAVKDLGVTPNLVNAVGWSINVATDLQSFLVGQHTADAVLAGTVTPFGSSVTAPSWADTAVNFVFGESGSEVMVPGGSTGVSDLGGVISSIASGGLWGGSLHIVLDLSDGDWDCLVGPSGAQVHSTGRNVVVLNYPIAWTPVQAVLAEGIRNRFREAVRAAVTGS
jgi:hypothetical protein